MSARLGRRILDLYVDGFRNMTVGRSLWALIIVKLLLLFAVLKIFFFTDILATRYDNDADRAAAVGRALQGNNPDTETIP